MTFIDTSKINPAKLCQLIDPLETIKGIQQGFEELDAGQTCPIGDFSQEMQRKYGIANYLLGKDVMQSSASQSTIDF